MSKVLLVDVDSRPDINNHAIGKFITYYKSLGSEIEIMKLKIPGYPHKKDPIDIDARKYGAVRVSIIFSRNKDMVTISGCNDVMYGGTGYDLGIKLPDDLEATLYGDPKERIEFLTRGCIRDCYFCLVRKKEGYLQEYRSLKRILSTYDGEKIRFFDNNFLAWDKSNATMETLIKLQIPVSFNEGLDIRLINDVNARLLSELNYYPTEYIFAFEEFLARRHKKKARISESLLVYNMNIRGIN